MVAVIPLRTTAVKVYLAVRVLGAVSSECLAMIFRPRRMIQVNAIWVPAGSCWSSPARTAAMKFALNWETDIALM